ncbi:tRNA 4-thiouridine(8) synthase ThiI, partial [Staphylococcus epidermidis]
MKYDHLIVRYGELTLKGSNRKKFVNQLKTNVTRALKPLDGFHIKGKRDRMYIELFEEADIDEIIHRLSKVYGIKSIS